MKTILRSKIRVEVARAPNEKIRQPIEVGRTDLKMSADKDRSWTAGANRIHGMGYRPMRPAKRQIPVSGNSEATVKPDLEDPPVADPKVYRANPQQSATFRDNSVHPA